MAGPDSDEPTQLFSPSRFKPTDIAVATRSSLLSEAKLNDPHLPKVHRILQRTSTSQLLDTLGDKLPSLLDQDLLAVADIMRTTISDIVLTRGAASIPKESEEAIGRFMKVMAQEAQRYNSSDRK
jgi:hypothetical protein